MFPVPAYLKVDNEQYQKWLSELKNGDTVLVQRFCPQTSSPLGHEREGWEFEAVEVRDVGTSDFVYYARPDIHPLRLDGVCCYWGSERPHGDVFPSRIVPYREDLVVQRYWTTPLYCPEWGGYRIYLSKTRNLRYSADASAYLRLFERSYSFEAIDAEVHVIFIKDYEQALDIQNQVRGIAELNYLYAQKTR